MDDTHRQNLAMHMDMPGEATTQGGWVSRQTGGGRWALDLRVEAWRTFQRAEMTMYPPGGAEMFMLTWPDASTLGSRADAGLRWDMTENVVLRAGSSLEGKALSLETALGRTQVRIVDPEAGSLRRFLLPGWNLGAALALSATWSLDAGLARESRAPDAAELWGFYLYRARDGRDQIGNASLAPETWNKAEAILAWKGRKASVQVKNWLALVEEAIETAPDGTPTMTPGAAGTVRWGNRGMWLRRGIELEASARWSVISAKGDFAWMAVDGPLGRNGSQVPAPGGHFRFAWIAVPGRLEVAGLAEWAVAQRKVDRVESEKGSEGYFVPELEVAGQIPSPSAKAGWKLAFENPLDLDWRSHLDWGVAPRPGRGFKLSLWASL
jgi:iron complex outermembrane receptor protein